MQYRYWIHGSNAGVPGPFYVITSEVELADSAVQKLVEEYLKTHEPARACEVIEIPMPVSSGASQAKAVARVSNGKTKVQNAG